MIRRRSKMRPDDQAPADVAAAGSVEVTLGDFLQRRARAQAEWVLPDQPDILLTADQAARFLSALEVPDLTTVARLLELRLGT